MLPQIRRNGFYALDSVSPDMITGRFMRTVTRALEAYEARIAGQTAVIAAQEAQIEEMAPKARYYDIVLQSPDPVKVKVIAKDYGMSAQRMNRLLHELGIQYKEGGIWFLYQKHAPYGYTRTRTHTYQHRDGTCGTRAHTYWTQKGRLWLYEQLKAAGHLPLVERDDAV